MVDVPLGVRSDLAERYRQVRPFDVAEVALVRALVKRPDRLGRRHEVALRLAFNIARTWVVQHEGRDVVIGHRLSSFRDRVRSIADRLAASNGEIDPRELELDAERLQTLVHWQIDDILTAHRGELSAERLDREIGQKKLVLALGGGGGCGYAHLGALSLLSSLQLQVDGVVGTSIGSVLALFLARDGAYRDGFVRMAMTGLRYSDIFRLLDGPTRYGIPGAMQLHLRSGIERFFLTDEGRRCASATSRCLTPVWSPVYDAKWSTRCAPSSASWPNSSAGDHGVVCSTSRRWSRD
ncbi:MAG: patatin-like phospholipase family protein [Myxococcales bacterium]|nr:patatin-like phospholipase family protein [Myxococcales bacterium]